MLALSAHPRIPPRDPSAALVPYPSPRLRQHRMIQVLALVPYPACCAPGQRYRIEQWIPHLGREGVHVTLSPFLSRRGMDVLYEPGHVAVKARQMLRGYLSRVVEALGSTFADVIFVY